MSLKINIVLVVLIVVLYLPGYAQYKALVTNLNTKKEYELKLNDVFYFGVMQNNEKQKGTLQEISATELTISGKKYKIADISWIDVKGRQPKKNTAQIARVLFYFGAGMIGVGAYEYYQANDKKTGEIVGATGFALTLGAIGFWLLPKQPQFDFSTKYLLEIIPISQETK
jgi:hypothetical protein